jgi:predicted nucleic acid-binding protein
VISARCVHRDAGRRLGVIDSWLAATAIALDVPLVTQNDHDDIPVLTVVCV